MSLRGEDALILAYDYTEKSLKDTGALKGQDGKDGVSPIISVNTSTEDTYKLDITDKNGTITTPNLVGKQGLQGIQGLQGTRGEKGADGVSPIVTENADNSDTIYKLDIVDANGTHTTPNLIGRQGVQGLKGDKGDVGEKGEQGIQGEAGKDGEDGTTYTPSIGEVTTVDSTELASASVSVNTETKEAVFNFAIPKGNKGLDGVQISDNETVEDKTWSSSKINSKLGGLSFSASGTTLTITNGTNTWTLEANS